MRPFVVDASLTLSWCFVDEATAYTRGVLAFEITYAVGQQSPVVNLDVLPDQRASSVPSCCC